LLSANARKNGKIARFSWGTLAFSATCGNKGASHEKHQCCCDWNGFAGFIARLLYGFDGAAVGGRGKFLLFSTASLFAGVALRDRPEGGYEGGKYEFLLSSSSSLFAGTALHDRPDGGYKGGKGKFLLCSTSSLFAGAALHDRLGALVQGRPKGGCLRKAAPDETVLAWNRLSAVGIMHCG